MIKSFKAGNYKWSLLGLVVIILLSGCGLTNPQTKQPQTIQSTDNKIEIAKMDNVTLFVGKETEDGMYEDITVHTKDNSKTFPWFNVTNPTYSPVLNTADVDGDGKDEITIILTTAYGTNVFQQEIQILNLEDLAELNIENPVEDINKKVTSTITKGEGKVNVIIKWDGNTIEKSYNETDAGIWNNEVVFGGVIMYEISGNKIIAKVPGAVSLAGFPVTAVVEYGPDLKVETLTVKEE